MAGVAASILSHSWLSRRLLDSTLLWGPNGRQTLPFCVCVGMTAIGKQLLTTNEKRSSQSQAAGHRIFIFRMCTWNWTFGIGENVQPNSLYRLTKQYGSRFFHRLKFSYNTMQAFIIHTLGGFLWKCTLQHINYVTLVSHISYQTRLLLTGYYTSNIVYQIPEWTEK